MHTIPVQPLFFGLLGPSLVCEEKESQRRISKNIMEVLLWNPCLYYQMEESHGRLTTLPGYRRRPHEKVIFCNYHFLNNKICVKRTFCEIIY